VLDDTFETGLMLGAGLFALALRCRSRLRS
jgi:hypothetical protein